jgi:two-component system CheB/CheR fusion protein
MASEKRYRRLFESAKDGILILDAETGLLVDVNPFLTELLGYRHEDLCGNSFGKSALSRMSHLPRTLSRS